MDTLPDQTLNRIKFNKSLVQISGHKDKHGISIGFEDGSSEGPFDLVVGCDGVNSAVKDYLVNDSIPKTGEKGKQALYSGIRIRYAVQDTNVANPVDNEGATLTQHFGNGAYGLTGIYGAGRGRSPIKCAFTIYLDDDYIGPFRKNRASNQSSTATSDDENADWSQDNRKGTCQLMLEQIEECGVPGTRMMRPIIEGSSRFFELGVYFHSPFTRNGWGKKVQNSCGSFCTLAGDAAHAMPPFLGQGSNQAIQDAYCLAKLTFEYNKALSNGSEEIDFGEVLKNYEAIRWGPTASISAKAFLLGYLEAGVGFVAKFRDAFFFTLGSLGVAKKVYLGAAVPEVGDEVN
jgi:salicylate hydroxylase